MKITLLSIDEKMTEAWKKYFSVDNVEIACEEFGKFMGSNHVDCVVSPANSFGLMDGGYDAAITDWFAYKQIYDAKKMSWEYAIKTHYRKIEY